MQFGARLHVFAGVHPVVVLPHRSLSDRRDHAGSTRVTALCIVPHKIDRVYNYHHATLHALAELLGAAGLEHPQELRPIHFSQRTATTEVQTFAKLYPSLRPGELIDGTSDARFRDAWAMARADTFAPAM